MADAVIVDDGGSTRIKQINGATTNGRLDALLDKLQDTAKGPFTKLTISCINTTGASGLPTGATAATFPIEMANNDTFKIFSGDHRVEGRIVAGDDCQITVSGVDNTQPVIEARHSKAKDQRRYVVSNAPTIDKVDVNASGPVQTFSVPNGTVYTMVILT
jgi:hypothetical protein